MELKISTRLEQLLHFRAGPIWDGNLISKAARDLWCDEGYVARAGGFQFLTAKGVELLIHLGYLNENSWRELQKPVPNGAHLCDTPDSMGEAK